MSAHFQLFAYGPLRGGTAAAEVLHGAERIGPAAAAGSLYDTGDGYPALVLAGPGTIRGEIWRCPAASLQSLDEHQGVEEGVFRRVGLQVEGRACWTYVAGPKLARLLRPERRIAVGWREWADR